MHRKALYNLLRFNWKDDPSLGVDLWQVEDYRILEDEELFERLHNFGITLDTTSFTRYVEDCESPEDLVDCFADELASPIYQDQAYLLLFELWRRHASHKKTLTIFCDDLDHAIESYDRGFEAASTSVESAIEHLREILSKNIDEGGEPRAVFFSICERCASDLESFLYDFISDQLENGNVSYAGDLTKEFMMYLDDSPWFALLNARLCVLLDEGDLEEATRALFKEFPEAFDIELGFEVLDFILQTDQYTFFLPLIKQLLILAEFEQDFRDILQELLEYVQDQPHFALDHAVEAIIERRKHLEPDVEIEHDDPDLKSAIDIVHKIAL